jgi:hypothetical protein
MKEDDVIFPLRQHGYIIQIAFFIRESPGWCRVSFQIIEKNYVSLNGAL